MFLLGNKFYIIFISLWIFGLYFIFSTFHSTSTNDKVFEDRIEYLQNEVESLRQKLSQLQSENNINDRVPPGRSVYENRWEKSWQYSRCVYIISVYCLL
jgi:hypothetical protein